MAPFRRHQRGSERFPHRVVSSEVDNRLGCPYLRYHPSLAVMLEQQTEMRVTSEGAIKEYSHQHGGYSYDGSVHHHNGMAKCKDNEVYATKSWNAWVEAARKKTIPYKYHVHDLA